MAFIDSRRLAEDGPSFRGDTRARRPDDECSI
jgi:hypothetical protein